MCAQDCRANRRRQNMSSPQDTQVYRERFLFHVVMVKYST
jgi:hypothetical protein